MKRIIYLLLSCLLLCGCDGNSMTIKVAELSKDEQRLLNLTKQSETYIFDYNVDSTVNEMIVTFYQLGDDGWEIINQSTRSVTNKEGRILLQYNDMREHLLMSCEFNDGYGSIVSDKISDSTILSGGGSMFSDQKNIIRNHEILLATQIWTEKTDIDTLDNGNINELYSFYSQRNYEEVYIITVLFK